MGEEMREKLKGMHPYIGAFLFPILSFILTECFLYNPFTDMAIAPWILNAWCYWAFAAVLIFATGRVRLALRIQTAFCMVIGLANYYVVQFRSNPILPWDIFSLRTAVSVADNYNFSIPPRVIFVVCGFIVLLLLEHFTARHYTNVKMRIIWSVSALLVLATFVIHMQREDVVKNLHLYDKLFTPGVMQKRNGLAGAFAMEMKYLVVQKPDDYDEQDSERTLIRYVAKDDFHTVVQPEEYPNIIVIMDEAFSDMAAVDSFSPSRDYMPFIRSLLQDENVMSGQLSVSVLGGNTANTEFEFLTGHSMAYFPQGSIPYQQYINSAISAMPSELRALGYTTEAMHPYHLKGWNRNLAYPYLGFKKLYFMEDMEIADEDQVRKYVSDAADFKMLESEFEARNPEKPFFMFNVTMQNHGGYTGEFDNFTPDITADGIKSGALSSYLSLVSMTDDALKDLITYFENVSEPTIIVFFGDHQPNDTVAKPILQANGKTIEGLSKEERAKRYLVPYFVWSNYDMPNRDTVSGGDIISPNYLAGKVMTAAGLPMNGYRKFLRELMEEYPVVSGENVIARDGTAYEEDMIDTIEPLLTYHKLQYYEMFHDED